MGKAYLVGTALEQLSPEDTQTGPWRPTSSAGDNCYDREQWPCRIPTGYFRFTCGLEQCWGQRQRFTTCRKFSSLVYQYNLLKMLGKLQEGALGTDTGKGYRVGQQKNRFQLFNWISLRWDKYDGQANYVGSKKSKGPFKASRKEWRRSRHVADELQCLFT